MVYGHEDRVIAEVREVLDLVEKQVNSQYLHQAAGWEIRGVVISELGETEREQALAEVLNRLDAKPRANLRALSDKARPLGVPPRTSVQFLINPMGEFVKRAYEHHVPLKTREGRKYFQRLYASPVSGAIAIVETRERLRGRRAGKLMAACVVVVPGGAFQPARNGHNRWAPTPRFQEWIDIVPPENLQCDYYDFRLPPRDLSSYQANAAFRAVGIDVDGKRRKWRPPEPGEPLPPGWQGPPPPGWTPPGGPEDGPRPPRPQPPSGPHGAEEDPVRRRREPPVTGGSGGS